MTPRMQQDWVVVEAGPHNNREPNRMGALLNPITNVLISGATFVGAIEVIVGLQERWPGSPLFYLVGALSSLVVGCIAVVVGLVNLLFTGKWEFLGKSFSVILDAEWIVALSPLALATFLTFIVIRTTINRRMSKKLRLGLIMAVLVFILIGVSTKSFEDTKDWFEQTVTVVANLFGTDFSWEIFFS